MSNVVPLRTRAAVTAQQRRPERVVYTVREVADLLGLSLGSTYSLVRLGEIPAKQLGGRWVIPKQTFHAWLDDQTNTDDLN